MFGPTSSPTYTIQIEEKQRLLLRKAIKIDPSQYTLEELDELELLIDMIDDLPKNEEESPGVIHGFCL